MMDPNPIQPPPQSIPPPQPVVPTPPPKKSSGILIGIFLLFLGILVGLVIAKTTLLSTLRIPYLSATPTPTPLPTPTPTPNPTANWKTYRNKIFSIKLPPSMNPLSCESNSCWSISTAMPSGATLTSISSPSTLTNTTWGEIVNYAKQNGLSYSERTIDGHEAIYLSSNDAHFEPLGSALSGYNEGVVIKKDKDQWEWVSLFVAKIFSPTNKNLTEDESFLFNQILSTFKFTDTTQSQQVLGIQLTQCCSCPTMIDASQIGNNGWVVYEQGKDYTAQLPKACSLPNIGACAPCPLPGL